jgi:hypothetical protein
MNELHLNMWWTIEWDDPGKGVRAKTIHRRAHDPLAWILTLSREYKLSDVTIRTADAEEILRTTEEMNSGKGPRL